MGELIMELFTISAERVGESSCLNGKIFKISKSNKTGELTFTDITTNKVLWVTTKVLDQHDDGKIITFKTASGSTYVVSYVSGLIPTIESDIRLLNDSYTCKGINHGDGYDMHTFTFNREITKEEFIGFLEKGSYKIEEKVAWYLDYSIINGEGKIWTYKWVRVYTD